MSSQTIFITAGATSQTRDISLVQNAGATSPGNPLAGLAYNSSGLVAYYRKGATGALTAITLATQTVTGAYSSGGFVEVSSANAPGQYRLDIPNAVIDTAGYSSITISGHADLAAHTIHIVVTAVDFYDAVRMGLTSLPNAAAAASGGLFTRGTGAGQINQDANGRIDVNLLAIGNDAQSATDLKDFADAGYDPATNKVQGVVTTDTATNLTNAPTAGDFTATMKTSIGTTVAASAVASVTGNVGGNVAGSVGSVATGGITAGSIATDAIGAAELAADATAEIAAAVWDLATSGHTTSATFGAQVKTLLDAIAAYIDTEVAAIKNVTDNLPDSGALTSLATAAELAKVPKSDSTVTWNATALASINAEVDTAIVDAAFRFGFHAEGTLSGTHSSTTADLGTAAPSGDISGFVLYIPSRTFIKFVDSYNTGTGVATFETTSATLTNGDPWYLFAQPAASTTNPLPVDVKKVNGTTIIGDGSSGDKFRGSP